MNFTDHDPLRGDGAENVHPDMWRARESAGADLMGLGVCALIVAVLVFTALWQVTG